MTARLGSITTSARDRTPGLNALSSLLLSAVLLGAAAQATAAQTAAQTTTAPPAGTASLPAAPQIPPLAQPASGQPASAPSIVSAQNLRDTGRLAPRGTQPVFFGLLGPFRAPRIPELFPGSGTRLLSLIRDGKLYLSLHDAVALALENNLDIEVERYNLQLADTDILRAKGGGTLRGIDDTIEQTPAGVGAPGSPLLNSTANSPNPITPAVTDLTSLNSTAQLQTNLSTAGQGVTYANGPLIPLFDPSFILSAGYLRRSNTVSLVNTTDTSGATGSGSGTLTPVPPLHFIAANAAYLQGFSPGTQLEAIVNNDSQVVYGSVSENDPFYAPSTSVTVTQPLLRGRGRAVNLRYLRIANVNRKVSRLLFEQQVLDTIYGISRLYFDLGSLGENVQVKREALDAAQKLERDDQDQVDQGTLAPIELARATALVGSSRFDLVQAEGLYQQEEVILRNQLIRSASPVFRAAFDQIVATDRITVPDQPEPLSTDELVQHALAQRPDLAQSELQVDADRINVRASRNQVLPQLNLYGNVETRGSSEQPYEQLGSTGTGLPSIPQNLALGGLRTSTIYQAGVQLTLPVRNRIAASDAARDEIQLRQAQARTERLSNQVRVDVENAVIAIQTAFSAYRAAVTSRQYQEQLLSSERDRLAFGQSTNLLVIQNEAYLAQARSTEIAVRSNWIKARIDLDRALGDLLERNHIQLEDAIQGTVRP